MTYLTVQDDGVGCEDMSKLKSSDSLGMQLVHSLVDQLGGRLKIDAIDGARFTVEFPLERPSPGTKTSVTGGDSKQHAVPLREEGRKMSEPLSARGGIAPMSATKEDRDVSL
jgi:hypothetical protein